MSETEVLNEQIFDLQMRQTRNILLESLDESFNMDNVTRFCQLMKKYFNYELKPEKFDSVNKVMTVKMDSKQKANDFVNFFKKNKQTAENYKVNKVHTDGKIEIKVLKKE